MENVASCVKQQCTLHSVSGGTCVWCEPLSFKLSQGPMTAIIIAAINDNSKTQIHTLPLCTANFTLPEQFCLTITFAFSLLQSCIQSLL